MNAARIKEKWNISFFSPDLFSGADLKLHKSWKSPSSSPHCRSRIREGQDNLGLLFFYFFFSHFTAVQVNFLQVSGVRMKEGRAWFTSVQCSTVQFCPTQQAGQSDRSLPPSPRPLRLFSTASHSCPSLRLTPGNCRRTGSSHWSRDCCGRRKRERVPEMKHKPS